MSTKRPRDENDDDGMDVEVQPERRRKLENETRDGESFLPALPKRSLEDTESYVFFKAFTLTQIFN